MASFRNILGFVSLFVVLSVVYSAPTPDDVALDSTPAGSISVEGAGASGSISGGANNNQQGSASSSSAFGPTDAGSESVSGAGGGTFGLGTVAVDNCGGCTSIEELVIVTGDAGAGGGSLALADANGPNSNSQANTWGASSVGGSSGIDTGAGVIEQTSG